MTTTQEAEAPRVGRPLALTKARQRAIVRSMEQGAYLSVAARAAGIHRGTLSRWLKIGREAIARRDAGEELTGDSARYAAFCDAVEEAEAHAEQVLVARWSAETRSDWRAAAELLARRHPDRWSPTKTVALTTAESDRRVRNAAAEILGALGLDAGDLTADPEENR